MIASVPARNVLNGSSQRLPRVDVSSNCDIELADGLSFMRGMIHKLKHQAVPASLGQRFAQYPSNLEKQDQQQI